MEMESQDIKTESSSSDIDFSRINLGSGNTNFKGWLNVDVTRSAQMHVDLSDFPWPFPDECADELFASHILEHFNKEGGLRFLEECQRILKPGGSLRLAVPDLDIFINAMQGREPEKISGYKWTDLNHFMGGDARETNPYQRHKYMYTDGGLIHQLSQAGFDGIRRREPHALDSKQWVSFSLLMEAYK